MLVLCKGNTAALDTSLIQLLVARASDYLR